MANEHFFCGRFFPVLLSYSADKAAQNCDNHVSLALFLKARLCFENATYLNSRRQITGYTASFCRSILCGWRTPPVWMLIKFIKDLMMKINILIIN